MVVGVAIRELYVARTRDGGGSGEGADGGADLVRDGDVRICRALRDERRALRVDGVELVHHHCLEAVAKWLETASDQSLANKEGRLVLTLM